MKKPNLFIIGLPRCGSTTLAGYLAIHPHIYLSPKKEPQHFGDDLRYGAGMRIPREEYLALYADAGDEHRFALDASVVLSWSDTAPDEIHAFSPDARIVFCLRNPLAWLRSLHQQKRDAGTEYLGFEEALLAEEHRLARPGWAEQALKEGRIVRYNDEQGFCPLHYFTTLPPRVQRYIDRFGRDNVTFVTLDQLSEQPKETMDRLYRWLGLEPLEQLPYIHQNSRVDARLRRLFKRCLPAFLYEWLRTSTAARSVYRVVFSPLRRRASRRKSEHTPLSAEARARIAGPINRTLAELETLSGLPLAHWRMD